MTQTEDSQEDRKAEQVSTEAPKKKYPLGVLFVHGIGEQPMGETLKSVVDPLVNGLDLWIHGAARCRALAVGDKAAREWANAMPATHTVAREQALHMSGVGEFTLDTLHPPQKEDVETATVWSGSALLADGRLPSTAQDDDAPPHAVLQVHTTNQAYAVTEGSALLAESWWARSFVPPTPRALMGWTLKVLPLAVGMHVGDNVRRHASAAFQPGRQGLLRLAHGLLALVWLVTLAVAVPLSVPLQCVLAASVVLGMVPLRFVQDAMRALQSTLVGTLGDSFLLVSSPVSRAMIVAQCKRDLDWLAAQCDQIFVVAHSQGCAVSYLAMCESLPDEVAEVTWIGSGLRKLEALRALQRNNVGTIGGWLSALLPFVCYGLVHRLVHGSWTWSDTPGQLFFTFAAVIGYLFCMGILIWVVSRNTTSLRLGLWQARGVRLQELHASHDPVPHGPMFDGDTSEAALIRSIEVRNQASPLADHTAYWRNLEEVMLPLSQRIAAAVRVPVSHLLAHDDAWLQAGVQRRHRRVNVLVLLRVLFLVCIGALLWETAAAWSTLARQGAGQASLLMQGQAELSALTPSLRQLVPDLLLWIALPWFSLMFGWRLWEEHEQRSLLLRKRPSGMYLGLLCTVMASAAIAPWVGSQRLGVVENLVALVVLPGVIAFAWATGMGGAEKAFELPPDGGDGSRKAHADPKPPGG